ERVPQGESIETVRAGHDFARKTFRFGGRWFDLGVDFGSSPAPVTLIDEVNRVLSTLQITPIEWPGVFQGWTTHIDLADRVSIDTPDSWTFNEDPVPGLLSPRILFGVGSGTFPSDPKEGGAC